MVENFQERILLGLLDDEDSKLIKKILKSPLKLASKIIKLLFEEDFKKLKNDLDIIKTFVAGISRAEKVSEMKYSLATYYPYMFAFQQFVNSSYRASQGKVLENILMNIIKNYTDCDQVPEKAKEMIKILSKIFNYNLPDLDIDAMGADTSRQNVLIIQVRSRDDTGGTTAKGSLVELLRDMLRSNKIPSYQILYLVCVWVARDSQQKKSTITKFYSSLKEHIDVAEEDFREEIISGIELRRNITLKLAYGTDEIANAIFEWSGQSDKSVLTSISKLISYIENWDDLWLAYAIANLELEIKYLYGESNIGLLEMKYQESKEKFNFNSYNDLVKSIDNITLELIKNWNEDTIPLRSLSDKAHYIRDLLFLKAYHDKGKQF